MNHFLLPSRAKTAGDDTDVILAGACIVRTVMDKMGYARGLVKYTTENAMSRGWTRAQTLRHVLRSYCPCPIGALGLWRGRAQNWGGDVGHAFV
jgi:hypothetical protein